MRQNNYKIEHIAIYISKLDQKHTERGITASD